MKKCCETVDKTKEFLVYEVKEQKAKSSLKLKEEKNFFVMEIESEAVLGDWLILGSLKKLLCKGNRSNKRRDCFYHL